MDRSFVVRLLERLLVSLSLVLVRMDRELLSFMGSLLTDQRVARVLGGIEPLPGSLAALVRVERVLVSLPTLPVRLRRLESFMDWSIDLFLLVRLERVLGSLEGRVHLERVLGSLAGLARLERVLVSLAGLVRVARVARVLGSLARTMRLDRVLSSFAGLVRRDRVLSSTRLTLDVSLGRVVRLERALSFDSLSVSLDRLVDRLLPSLTDDRVDLVLASLSFVVRVLLDPSSWLGGLLDRVTGDSSSRLSA